MKRIIITGAALLAIAPVSLGLMGNASFAQSVPVRVPSQATVVGGQSKHIEIGHDHGGTSTHAEAGDDKSGTSTHAEPGDDKSGTSTHAEAGDDKSGTSTHAEAGDDKSGPSTHVMSGDGTSGPRTQAQPGDDKGGPIGTQVHATDDKVGTSGSGKVDDGGAVDVSGGTDGGAGHP